MGGPIDRSRVHRLYTLIPLVYIALNLKSA
jgi:hypothetical protein